MVVGDNHQIGVGTSLVKVVVNGQIVGQFLQLAASHNRIVETNFGAFAALAQSLDHVERHRAPKIVGFRPAFGSDDRYPQGSRPLSNLGRLYSGVTVGRYM